MKPFHVGGFPDDLASFAADFTDFVDHAPDPFHAVAFLKDFLQDSGSRFLAPDQVWSLAPGTLYHSPWGSRGLAVFRTAATHAPPTAFRIATAHTDSPCLKLRTGANEYAPGLLMTRTEVYGSLIKSSVADRPLKVSGEVVIRRKEGLENRGIVLEECIGTIPQLAIHLNRDVNKGFEFNEHQHLRVFFPLGIPPEFQAEPWAWLCARELAAKDKTLKDLKPSDVVHLDLHLSDAQGAVIMGQAPDLWVNSPRIDNLAGCHALIHGLASAKPGANHQLALLYDHEEVGSRSTWGADSIQTERLLRRINAGQGGTGGDQEFFASLAGSRVYSVDGAQAFHPNFSDRFDPVTTPVLGKGPSLKMNAQQRYASEPLVLARVREAALRRGIPLQSYAVKADMSCGSTVGPMVCSLTGVPGADLGIPMLAMHSAREFASLADQYRCIQLLCELFEEAC